MLEDRSYANLYPEGKRKVKSGVNHHNTISPNARVEPENSQLESQGNVIWALAWQLPKHSQEGSIYLPKLWGDVSQP